MNTLNSENPHGPRDIRPRNGHVRTVSWHRRRLQPTLIERPMSQSFQTLIMFSVWITLLVFLIVLLFVFEWR
jgi:hypothetical protein